MKFRSSTLVISSLAIGLGVGGYIGSHAPHPDVTAASIFTTAIHSNTLLQENRADATAFTNPLLDCTDAEVDFTELVPFKKKVVALVDQRVSWGDVTDVAVYFRDLNNGPWFAVNQDEKFQPGSLLKIPLAISYYQYASRSEGVFSQKYTWTPDPSNPMGPPITLKAGQSYTVRELINRMLVNSDNAATDILYSHIPAKDFQEPYKDFGQSVPVPSDPNFDVTAMGYSSFLRILYNASYLSRSASEEILEQLSHSDFLPGLRAGVPSSVPIAHKYGERLYPDGNNELHDCGIIYYPKHPYMLCVMTKGHDTKKMADVIKNIAALAYHEVDSQLSQ